MKVVLDLIQSKKQFEEKQKEQILNEYSDAIEQGNDVLAIHLSNYLSEINNTISFLDEQEKLITSEKNYYEFTFDLTRASYEYSQIKSYMLNNGFEWKRDSDYITLTLKTRMEMTEIEKEIKVKFPWLLEKATKIYDSVISDVSDVYARWIAEEEFVQAIEQEELAEQSNNLLE